MTASAAAASPDSPEAASVSWRTRSVTASAKAPSRLERRALSDMAASSRLPSMQRAYLTQAERDRMSYLVTAATGNIGSATLNALVNGGERVRAVSRSEREWPEGVEGVVADLDDPDGLR